MKYILLQVKDEDQEPPFKNIDHPEEEHGEAFVMKGERPLFFDGAEETKLKLLSLGNPIF